MDINLLRSYYKPKGIFAGDPINPNNLFSANVATGTDTLGNITGFEPYRSATVTSSTDTAKQGAKSCKIVTPGTLGAEGVQLPTITGVNGTHYCMSGWIFAPQDSVIQIKLVSGNVTDTYLTGNNAWQSFTSLNTLGGTSLILYIRTRTADPKQAITFYVDKLQMEIGDTPTAWGKPS